MLTEVVITAQDTAKAVISSCQRRFGTAQKNPESIGLSGYSFTVASLPEPVGTSDQLLIPSDKPVGQRIAN